MNDKNFFENLRQLMPEGSVARIVITRENEEFLVTSEFKKDVNSGFTSPLFHRGHWSVLDQQFWPKMIEGVNDLKPLIFDKNAAVASAGGKVEASAPANKPAGEVKKPGRPKAQPLEKSPDLLNPKEDEAVEDQNAEEVIQPAEVTAPVKEPIPPIQAETPVAAEVTNTPEAIWDDSLLEPAKEKFRAKDYVSALQLLEELKKIYPNASVLDEKISNVKSKLPPPPEDEDF